MRRLPRFVLPVLLLLGGCAAPRTFVAPAAPTDLDPLAERYVRLVLALGQHDPNFVDAYYGPPQWAEEARSQPATLEELGARAATLAAALEAATAPDDELGALRHRFLTRQLGALRARVRLLLGEKLSFDAESQALYDATSPARTAADFEAVLQELDGLLPGAGPLAPRLEAFRARFVIPKDRIDTVFRAAIAEARERTVRHLALPEKETFELEYVTGKSWGGYNWYKGGAHSLIQINLDFPIHPWRAVDLAAHEGYPGHHVYNVLLEQHLVKERGWLEFTVYALFSPQSLIAEGTANYGIEVAFPDAAQYAQQVLFPLAGLDPEGAADYVRVERLVGKLDFAANEAARGYLDGTSSRDEAQAYLVRYVLMTEERASRRLDFIDTYRTYVINYNVGRELVRQYVEGEVGTGASADARRWEVFRTLLSTPRLPADLRR
jgi:hypothetical protein